MGGGSRGELPESDRTETPRPRERFTDAEAELQGPKDSNHPAPSEGKDGKEMKKIGKKIEVK